MRIGGQVAPAGPETAVAAAMHDGEPERPYLDKRGETMKKLAVALVLLTAFAGASFAKDGNFGLGIIFGEPTGVSFKLWTGEKTAFDAAAAWSFVGGTYFQVHGDLLFHNFDLFEVETGTMALYYGFGGRVKLAEAGGDTKFSLRVPLGISYQFERTDIELFLEIAPMLDLAPKTQGSIAGGIGFRYFF
jgi:hypothetical protein